MSYRPRNHHFNSIQKDYLKNIDYCYWKHQVSNHSPDSIKPISISNAIKRLKVTKY